MPRAPQYWLFKSEPESFSIRDLAAAPKKTTGWDGVRNYQARNFLRDQIKPDDRVLFYHSSVDPPAVAGTAVVVRGGHPDSTAWKKGDHHFDPKCSPENPIWYTVDIRLEEIFDEPIPLDALRREPALKDMVLLQRGSRLSVQPVTKREFETVLKLARAGSAKSKKGKK
ncbi:MAG: EVE domain-containing protein [Planctomycetia bacterium]|nr:EVE domain-containing protein [Planctomycetia bacterium]